MHITNLTKTNLGPSGGGGGEINISNIVCTNSSNTPQGVTWTSGGTSITGTLVASASLVNNRYFVLSEKSKAKNIYKEYVSVLSNGSYIWEELGNIDVPASTYTAVYDLADPTHSTPYADVLSAFQAGKRIQVKYGEKFFPLEMVQAEDFYFVGIDNEETHKAYTIICRSYGSWEANNEDIALKNDVLEKPASGTTGQVLKKTASGTEWADEAEDFIVKVTLKLKGDSSGFEIDPNNPPTKTFAQISAAYTAGKHCIAFVTEPVTGFSGQAPLTAIESSIARFTAVVHVMGVSGLPWAGGKVLMGIHIGSSNSYFTYYKLAPNSSSSNVNHLLMLDSAGNVADSGKTTADLQDVIYGYMNNSTFYLTRTGSAGSYVYSDAVTPEQNKQYTDKEGNVPYVWDGAEYHAIGGSSGVPEAPIDGKPYYRKNGAWADASVGETETVYIHFSSSDSQLTLLGLQASISFADGSATRLLTADASGNCSTMIDVGKVYTITVADQTGYQHIASKTLKASLAERNVYFNYEKNISGGDCTITVTLTCSGGRVGEAPSWEGTSVNLSLSNNTARTATVVGGVATFTNVTRGLSGKVSCTKLSGWITPTIANVDTTLQTIGVTMNYARVSATGIFMVASTGEEYTYQTWDTSLTCVAIHIATSALSEAGADYYVRINDLNANNLTGKAWQTNLASNWRALPNVHYYNASTPYYDGETDTAMMISDCADIEETSPAAQWAIQQSFTHLGVPHAGFIPTRDQFQPMFDNKDYIYNCYNLATGNTANYYTSQLWSASQSNANCAWYWYGGSWLGNTSKGGTFRVLAVFAI